MFYNTTDPVLSINLEAIKHNYRLLAQKTGTNRARHSWPRLLPVIKADAYGHGLAPVALALLDEGVQAFAIGSVEEGVRLRQALTSSGRAGNSIKILALLGASCPEEAELALEHGLTLCLHRPDQLKLFAPVLARRKKSPLGLALKLDTGMSRLGFGGDALQDLLQSPLFGPVFTVEMLMTHLSSADIPQELKFTRKQASAFADALEKAGKLIPGLAGSMCNSAGLLNCAAISDSADFCENQVARPGISLYGSNPFYGSALESLGRGLKPAMQLLAPVLEVRDVRKGGSVSYARSFKAEQDTRIAVLRCGYADGYPRLLSGRAPALLGGVRTSVVGNVCMQMLFVEVPKVNGQYARVAPGDYACLLGGPAPHASGTFTAASESGGISAEELAALSGTISYEIYCSLGRNKKIYPSATD